MDLNVQSDFKKFDACLFWPGSGAWELGNMRCSFLVPDVVYLKG